MLGSDERAKDQVVTLMSETREARRCYLNEGFSTAQIIRKILRDYPKLMEFQGLLVRSHINKS